MGVRDLVFYQKAYDATLYALPILNRLPKSYRPTLARDLQGVLVRILTGIVAANQDPVRRADLLRDLDTELETARVLLRLGHDLQAIPTRHYGQLSEKLDELGRLLGGWRGRSQKGPGGFRPRSGVATGTMPAMLASSPST